VKFSSEIFPFTRASMVCLCRAFCSVIRDCRVLNIEEATTRHYSDIHVELKKTGTSIPVNDVWIAALSGQRRLPLVSRDCHFDSVPHIQRVS
jgi:predicted nucleic acid-binding protein